MRNSSYILAIELLAACQALDLGGRAPELSAAGRAVHAFVRASIPPVVEDRYMSDEIELAAELIRTAALLPVVEEAGITLQ